MRERIEDLGRLSVLLNNLVEVEVFHLYRGRNKDFSEYFETLNDEKKEDLLDKLIYGLTNIRENLFECITIADGCDSLNDPVNE